VDQPATVQDVEADPVAYELVQRRLRRHQSAFRDNLMRAYEGRCAISGTAVPAVLEAAHIEPHVDRGDNSAGNGLLLRSDLHALFDEGLLRIHPETLEVQLDASVDDPHYSVFNGRKLRPRIDKVELSIEALEARWRAP
jgi:predicted restriction endonuclease